MTIDTHMVELDMMNVRLLTPGGEINGARLVLTNMDLVLVYAMIAGSPGLAITGKWKSRKRPESRSAPFVLEMEDGEEWYFWQLRGSGCNCNNPLSNVPLPYDMERLASGG